jgi:hypothetical protein
LYLFSGNSKKKLHKHARQALEAGNPKKAGQAVIRGEPNAHEIELKHGPNIQKKDYFTDEDMNKDKGPLGKGLWKFEESLMHAFARAHHEGFDELVLPPNNWLSEFSGRHNMNLMDKNQWVWHEDGKQDKVKEYILGRQRDMYALAGRGVPRSPEEIAESIGSIGFSPVRTILDENSLPIGNMTLDESGRWVAS